INSCSDVFEAKQVDSPIQGNRPDIANEPEVLIVDRKRYVFRCRSSNTASRRCSGRSRWLVDSGRGIIGADDIFGRADRSGSSRWLGSRIRTYYIVVVGESAATLGIRLRLA